MPPTAKKRKPELAWMSLAFCMMVLFSHCAGHPITHLRNDSWQFALLLLLQRLTYVSVYGFFVISGIKFMLPRSKPLQWRDYFLSRAKGLLLPYLAANVIYYAFYCWVVRYYVFDWGDFFDYLLRGNLVSPFYYLIVMFQLTLLGPAFKWVAEHIPAKISLPIALVISWGSELYLSLRAKATAVGECARCLDPVSESIELEREWKVREDDLIGEDELPVDAKGVLDLDELLFEELVLEGPTLLLCSEDCTGLCPVCGLKKAAGCTCEPAEEEAAPVDARLAILRELLD